MMIIVAAALASEAPHAFIDRIYASYRNENYSPLDHPNRIFAPQLNAAIEEDIRHARGEVGFLDGDPLCDCQDTGGMHSRTISVERSGDRARARVLLQWTGTGDRDDMRLKLVRTPAGWRIADVRTANERSLLKDLQEWNRKGRKH